MYVIFSPSTTYASPFSVVDFFSADIIASTYVFVVSFVGSSSTVAIFLIIVPLFKSVTFTLNSNVLLSPASIVTSIPLANSSAVFPVAEPPTFILPSTNVVPVGMLSFTITVSGAVPFVLSNVIVYVISFPTFTLLPVAGSDVLLTSTFGLFTVSVTSSVGVPSTIAVFPISFLNSPSVSSFTVTSKLNVPSPLSATGTVIPFFKFVCVSCVAKLFTFILPSTKLVPSGISSFTTTPFAKSPSFVIVMVYVIFSPSTT